MCKSREITAFEGAHWNMRANFVAIVRVDEGSISSVGKPNSITFRNWKFRAGSVSRFPGRSFF